eukprot:Skav222175  [mRNA]  locus=scaffold3048:270233:276461:- [translate_table: standard]
MSRAAFRRLQRLCRQFDREPSLQLGLVGRPPRVYDWHFNRAVRTRFQGCPFAEEMVWEAQDLASGFSTQFAMPRRDGSVARAGRHFRRAEAMGLPYQSHLEHPSSDRFAPREASISEAALLAQRFQAAKLLIKGLKADQTEETPKRMGGDGDAGRTYEKKSPGKHVHAKSVQLLCTKEWAETIESHPAIEKLTVFRGGPIIVGASLQRNLHWLHGFSTVSGGQEVAPGLWMGGDLIQILDRVAHNQVDGPLVRPCFGHASWAAMQLQLELECGGTDGLSATATACLDDWQHAWQKALLHAGQLELVSQRKIPGANLPRGAQADAKLRLHIDKITEDASALPVSESL